MRIDRRTKHLMDVKLGLAEKYDRLSADARSKNRRIQLYRKAEKYRRQAREVLRNCNNDAAKEVAGQLEPFPSGQVE